jgi:hypothetical protein
MPSFLCENMQQLKILKNIVFFILKNIFFFSIEITILHRSNIKSAMYIQKIHLKQFFQF